MKKNIVSKQNKHIGLAIILTFIILFPLFSLPRPSLITGHPWKVELLSSIFLLVSLIWISIQSAKTDFLTRINFNKQTKYILLSLLAFTLLSGFSIFWANSALSVAHHSFNWLIYLLLFIGFIQHLKEEKSYKLVISVISLITFIVFVIAFIDFLSAQDFSSSAKLIRIRYAKFAELLLLLAPVLLALAINVKNKHLLALYLVVGSFAWMTIMFSMSKGAFIAGVSAFLLMFVGIILFSKSHFRKKAAFIAVFWLLLTIGTQAYFSIASELPSTADFISGKANSKNSTSQFRIFSWKITAQMIADNPILGVGADNFGTEINEARKQYALSNPKDPQNAIAEDFMVERSHNEFLQILSELGIIGFLFFLTPFLLLAFWVFKSFIANKYKFSPMLLGSIAGIVAFFISSQFSSFSFRATQNGIVFFIVLAILVNELSKINAVTSNIKSVQHFIHWKQFAIASSVLLVCLASISFFAQGISNYFVMQAQSEAELIDAEKYINKALLFNKENSSAHFNLGMKLYSKERFAEAIPHLQKATKKGLGLTIVYYYLAQSHVLLGETKAAEEALAETLEIFPHSIYARTHYATLLKQNGKIDRSIEEFEIANKLNPNEAKSWKLIFEDSVLTATLESQKNKDLVAPDELYPHNVIIAVLGEETLKEERQKNKVSIK